MPDSQGRNRKNEYRADAARSAQLPNAAPHTSSPREPHDRTRPDKRSIASNTGAIQNPSPAGSAIIRPLRQAGRVYNPNANPANTSAGAYTNSAAHANPAHMSTGAYNNSTARTAPAHTNTGAYSNSAAHAAPAHSNTGAYSNSAAHVAPTHTNTGTYSNIGMHTGAPTTNSGNQGMRSSLRPIQPTHTGQSVQNPSRRSGYVQPVTVRGELARPTKLEGLSTRRKKSPKRRRNLTALKDFCLGLVIGFVVFGTAAYFVVNAVIDMFDMF